jgi:hypothetical protein
VEEVDDEHKEDIEVVEDGRKSGSDIVEDQEVKFKGVIEAVDLSDDEKGVHPQIDEKSVALNSSFDNFNFHPNQKEDQTIYSKAK